MVIASYLRSRRSQCVYLLYNLLVSNTSKSNLDFTINYLNKSFSKAKHFLVANSLDINFLTKDHDITILDNLDDFVKIIS